MAFDYPVAFTRDLFKPSHSLFADILDRLKEKRRHRALVFIDSGVAQSHPDLSRQIRAYFKIHEKRLDLILHPLIVPGGEKIKNNIRLMGEIIQTMVGYHLCRYSPVVTIGGGAVLDAIGFCASLVHRGLRLVRVPTTVLSQSDGGVGVKNGINLAGGKNTIGTFTPPFAVLNDSGFLSTLRDREWSGGIAEAFKVAIIRNAPFFKWLCGNASLLKRRNQAAMEQLVTRCAQLHLKHIRSGGDPFEFGRARPLDFGHWSAHKLEGMSEYRISHGQAVAIGVALDSCYAALQGWITGQQWAALCNGLRQSGLGLWRAELERRAKDGTLEILKGLRDFQEHIGGELCLTFPKGIGKALEVHEMDHDLLEEAIVHLKQHDEFGVR